MITSLGNKKGDLVDLLNGLEKQKGKLAAMGNNLSQPVFFLLDDAIWLVKKSIENEMAILSTEKKIS